jgi:predicted transglutaminase-like protease
MKIFLIIIVIIGTLAASAEAKTWKLWGDGHTDDTKALKAWGRGEQVKYKGRLLGKILENGKFYVTKSIIFIRGDLIIRNNTFLIKDSAIEIYPINCTNKIQIRHLWESCTLSSINDNGRKN